MNPNQYTKAIVGAVLAGLGAVGTAITDGEVTGLEWVTIATITISALALVWGVPNAPTSPVAGETPATPLHVELESDSGLSPVVGRAPTKDYYP